MKTYLQIFTIAFSLSLGSCGISGKAKRGCPANDRALGAERVLAGEGKKKPSKFKVKGMN